MLYSTVGLVCPTAAVRNAGLYILSRLFGPCMMDEPWRRLAVRDAVALPSPGLSGFPPARSILKSQKARVTAVRNQFLVRTLTVVRQSRILERILNTDPRGSTRTAVRTGPRGRGAAGVAQECGGRRERRERRDAPRSAAARRLPPIIGAIAIIKRTRHGDAREIQIPKRGGF